MPLFPTLSLSTNVMGEVTAAASEDTTVTPASQVEILGQSILGLFGGTLSTEAYVVRTPYGNGDKVYN